MDVAFLVFAVREAVKKWTNPPLLAKCCRFSMLRIAREKLQNRHTCFVALATQYR